MSRLFLVPDPAEIARRRQKLPKGQIVEAWPDRVEPGECWVGETSKALLDGAGSPLPARLRIDGVRVPIYYGPRLCDLDSLPPEESLRGRVLAAHGIAALWITLDAAGARASHEPASPDDPVFFLRRPGGGRAHVWRLFRRRDEALAYVRERRGGDEEAAAWAAGLPAASWDELITRYATSDDS
jgi:hypothetical protein